MLLRRREEKREVVQIMKRRTGKGGPKRVEKAERVRGETKEGTEGSEDEDRNLGGLRL